MSLDRISEVAGRSLAGCGSAGTGGEGGPDNSLVGFSRGRVRVAGVSGERFMFGHADRSLICELIAMDADVGLDFQEVRGVTVS